MKIKEVVERECCHPLHDLKPYRGRYKYGFKSIRFCDKCGQLHYWVRRAGERDGGIEAISDTDMKG